MLADAAAAGLAATLHAAVAGGHRLTYLALRFSQREALRQPLRTDIVPQPPAAGARLTGTKILLTALVLMLAWPCTPTWAC